MLLASIHMQKHCATLDDCQFQCDIIAELAKEGYGKRNHDFQYCICVVLLLDNVPVLINDNVLTYYLDNHCNF